MNRVSSLVAFLIVALSQGAASAQVKVRAAYGTPSLSQVVFPLGVHAGMFSRQGLTVEPLYIAGRSINLLLSGDVQFGFTGGPHLNQWEAEYPRRIGLGWSSGRASERDDRSQPAKNERANPPSRGIAHLATTPLMPPPISVATSARMRGRASPLGEAR